MNELKSKETPPIYYENIEEMQKPLSELMKHLRYDIVKVRGKLYDIKSFNGWNDRIEHIEGALTCVLQSMYSTMKEWEEFEAKYNNLKD